MLVRRILGRLRDAGLRLVKNLWPSAVMPRTANRLARWLEAAPERVDAWRAFAARTDAEITLSFVLSWYPEVDLAQLASRRAGAEAELAPLADAIGARASDLAFYALFDEFVKERVETGEEILEDIFGIAFDDPEGSAGETDGEETGTSADAYTEPMTAAEADTGVTTSVAAETENPEPTQVGADAPNA